VLTAAQGSLTRDSAPLYRRNRFTTANCSFFMELGTDISVASNMVPLLGFSPAGLQSSAQTVHDNLAEGPLTRSGRRKISHSESSE